MKPWVLSQIPKEDAGLLENIRCLVNLFPDNVDLGKDLEGKPIVLSCHILAHALGQVLDLTVQDGYFIHHYDHSWLKTIHGNIIDVYPVGILGGPILVDQISCYNSPGPHLYRADIMVWHRVVAEHHIQNAIFVASRSVSKAMQKICQW